jgi:hypothetical protein
LFGGLMGCSFWVLVDGSGCMAVRGVFGWLGLSGRRARGGSPWLGRR